MILVATCTVYCICWSWLLLASSVTLCSSVANTSVHIVSLGAGLVVNMEVGVGYVGLLVSVCGLMLLLNLCIEAQKSSGSGLYILWQCFISY